jgi:hypothetical protein
MMVIGEPRCFIIVFLKQLRQSDEVRAQGVSTIDNLVPRRRKSREKRCHARDRPRRRRVSAFEKSCMAAQLVQRRASVQSISVLREMIGAKGVDHHQNNVGNNHGFLVSFVLCNRTASGTTGLKEEEHCRKPATSDDVGMKTSSNEDHFIITYQAVIFFATDARRDARQNPLVPYPHLLRRLRLFSPQSISAGEADSNPLRLLPRRPRG